MAAEAEYSWEAERPVRSLRPVVFGALGAMALFVVGWVICSGGMSREEAELSALIDQLAQAASQHDLGPVARHLSPDFVGPRGRDKNSVMRWLDSELQKADWSDILITRRSIEVEGTQATAELVALLSRGGDSGLQSRPHRIKLHFSRDSSGNWVVSRGEYQQAQVKDFF